MEDNKDFTVACNVCGHQYDNWVGITPCCGSLAFLVNEDGATSKKAILHTSFGVATLDFSEDEHKR